MYKLYIFLLLTSPALVDFHIRYAVLHIYRFDQVQDKQSKKGYVVVNISVVLKVRIN